MSNREDINKGAVGWITFAGLMLASLAAYCGSRWGKARAVRQPRSVR